MNKIATVALIVGVTGAIGGGSAWAGTFTDRQWARNHRMFQGIRSGALTRGEVRALYGQQHRIHRLTHNHHVRR